MYRASGRLHVADVYACAYPHVCFRLLKRLFLQSKQEAKDGAFFVQSCGAQFQGVLSGCVYLDDTSMCVGPRPRVRRADRCVPVNV